MTHTMAGVRWSTAELAAHYKRIGSPSPIADACGEKPAKRSKYGVDQSAAGKLERTCDGIMFDSKVEMRDYQTLKIAQQVGAISNLELQPRFLLQEKFTDAQGRKHRASFYVSDFKFQREGKTVAVDRKGRKTAQYRDKIKRAILQYPDVVFEEWG